MNDLYSLLGRLGGAKIAVFGDIMLDEFTYGSVSRVSPEAPVPVVDVESTEYRLGGCGNVAANIAAMGAKASVFSVVGDDSPASKIGEMLKEHGIEDMTVVDGSRPTTKKNRLVAHNQQVARLDWEKRHAISPAIEEQMLSSLKEKLSGFDAVILSDYGKGFLTDRLCRSLIDSSSELGKSVIVDPKSPFGKYAGADTVTPNFREFVEYSEAQTEKSPAGMHPHAADVMKQNNIKRLLVTLGENGMVLFEKGKYAKVNALRDGHDVVDITGAGDTAVAVYSLAVAAGANYVDAMRLANYAAGVVVTKFGTVACSLEELRSVIGKNDGLEEVYL